MPSFTDIFGSTSSPKESDNKRVLGDTSIISDDSINQATTKRPNLNVSDTDSKDSEQSLIKALELMFTNFQSTIENKLNVISDKLDVFDTWKFADSEQHFHDVINSVCLL